ncbi:MAG: pyridoxal phosphate-dependent aminotransferase [Candidatus Omnitrophica bacterium]|nr:pyridoxal phosphate-dependent aminotransferase [Candidatus Omnitrophota bacterium]
MNRRVASLSPSATLAITAKAKQLKNQGVDVVNFAGGEPDFDTPQPFKDAAIRALKEGMTRYTPTTGLPQLKEAIAEKLKRDNQLEYKPEQIVVTVGAKHAVFNAIQVLVDEGDEVIVPAPYWLSYPEMVKMAGGRNVFVTTSEEQRFKITPELLKRAISPASKVLILNSPSNPTGVVYSKEELTELTRIAVDHGIFVVSDEIYEKLIYGNTKHYAVAALEPRFKDSVITVNGLSKAYAMTGWRLGYFAAPLEIAKAASSLQDHQTSNVTSFAQPAAVEALRNGEGEAAKLREIFSNRRDLIISELRRIPQVRFVEPDGAFYVFVNITKSGLNSMEFSQRILEEVHIALIPGSPFGAEGYVRISFATSEREIVKGTERMRSWLKK